MERGRPKAPGGFTPRNTLAEPKKKQLFPNKFTDFIIAPFLPSKERTNEEPPLKRQKLDKVSTEDIDSTEDELVDTVPAARRAQNGSQKSSIQEYNNVEKMMRPTSQKRGKHAGRAMADEGKLPVQTVDLRSPNPEAEPETVTPKSKSPEKSRYFPLGMEAIRQNVVDGLATDIRAKPTTNGGFAPPDSSPDELGGEFKPRRRSPDRVPGSNNVVIEIESQESAPKAIPTPRMVRRAPSLSQPSHSSQPSRYKGVNSFRASREDVGGDIGLKSIAYRLKAYNDGSMGLVFNKSQGQIEFMREGQKVDEVARVDKIRRVVYCASDPTCPKYRFELASNNAQGRTVDIECFNIRDYKNLLAELRLRNLSLYPKEPEYMNKMFAKHLQELVELRFRHNNRPEIAEDVQHVATTIKRPQKRGLLVNAENEGKRPRLLKDKLQDVHTSKKAPTPLRDRVLSKSTTSELLHDAITPLPTADTERRRSGRLTRSSLSREEVSSLPYEFPEEERYSKKHGLGKSWKKPLIFPPAGKKRATVDFDDLPRLDEGQFLNDNLIEFYLRRLSHTIETEKPREVKNIYWFNTYFFATLTQPTRGKGGAINFDGVKKWTRGEDLFNYDYIVVPINESAHWYVAIICNLPYLDRGLPDELADVPEHVVVDASPVETLNKGDQSEGSSDLVDLVELINASTNKSSPQDEPQLLEPDSSEPEVKGTTGSFSNLSLDDKPKSPMQNERVPVNPNEDMLFDEEKSGTLSAADEPKDNSVTARESTQDEVIEIVAPSKAEEPRVSPTAVTKRRPGQRMGRRKSAPVRRYDPSTPAIIILDSLGIEHAPTISVLKAYLEEEAKDKRGGMEFDRNRLQGMNAKGIPRQDNFCDCGLYLLGYMDKFVEDPRKFVTKLLRKEFDEREDWPDLKPSTMRNNIRELLVELHAEQEGAKPDKRKAAMRVSDTRPNIDPSNEVAGLKPSADDRHVTPPETRESTTNSPPSAQLTANLIQHLEDTAKAIGEDEQPKTSEISQPSPDEVTVIVPDSQDDQPIQTMAERPLEPPATEETRPEEPLTRSKSVEEVLKENIQSPIVPTSQESSKEAILGGEEDKARKNIRRSRNRYEPVPRPSQLVPSVVID